MATVTVVRTYLELTSRDALRPAATASPDVSVVRVPAGDISTFRRMYHDVGATYYWRDRNALSDDMLRDYLASPDVQLWVLEVGGELAGFFELKRHDDRSVEIVYFGLVSRVFGRGLGKHLLTCAAERAWEMGADRVWLHTCTLDSPAALPNYLARGFDP